MATRTFLFVDQVGSTEQLTRLGDAAAQRVRRALFDLLRQATEVHGGHEVDFTGDGLFCAFEGAVDGVAAAVDMQQLVTSFNARQHDDLALAIRIGLNTGEPLESEGGGYFGAAVVVAARLCSAAAAGEILASGVVRSLVEARGNDGFSPVGAKALKGIPEPVETYAVAWEPDERAAALPGALAALRSGPFVGRDRELAAIGRAWDDALTGRRRLVLVSGESGMGVSRLLAEGAAARHADGAVVWAGGGQGEGSRLAPWAEALGQWQTTVSRAELRLAVGEQAADLRRLTPGLADLVPRLPAPAPMDPAAEVFLVADAVDALAARVSAAQPLVVVLDRLHDADPASLTVLRRLTESRRGGRVLVLGGYAPSAVGTPRLLRALVGVPDVVDLPLAGLDAAAVGELTAAVAGHPPGESSVRAVLAESEGNPFFVLQMARSLREQGVVRQVRQAVERAAELRTDLRLRREEIVLGLRELDQLRAEDRTEAGAVLDAEGTPPAPGTNPWRGLLAYTEDDAGTFFGREALVAEMVAALSTSAWLAVLGPSGSGKSSAVRAGLLPALAAGAVPGSEAWLPVRLRPGAHPVAALSWALAGAAAEDPDPDAVVAELLDAGLAATVRRSLGGRRVLLVVDQFEELWTAAAEEDRRSFLDLLVSAVGEDDPPLAVVLTLRADHYGRTAEFPELAALMAGAQVLVPPMTPAELRAAVEGPAREADLVLEPGLAQAIIDDVAGEPGGLPLLSTALQETWERRRGRSLTLTGYAETGGARRAIAHLADATLDELEPEQQEVARRLLLRLAVPAADGSDVARPAPLRELVVDARTEFVLSRLVERRLVTAGETTAQVAHEALLREWPRLRRWLEADREGRRLHQQVAAAAEDWETAGRDDGALLRGARLAAAAEWRTDHEPELTERERLFLTASARRARRTTRRLQALAVVLLVLFAAAGVSAVLAVRSSQEATARAVESTARGLAAQAVALAGSRTDTALLLAVEGYRRDPSLDTESGLLSALNGARYLDRYAPDLPSGIATVDPRPGGGPLLLLTLDGTLQEYDAESLRPGRVLAGGIDTPFYAEYSPDGTWIALSDRDGVRLFDAATGAPGLQLGGGAFATFSFSSDGSVIAVGSPEDSPSVRVLDTRTGAELGAVDGGPGPYVSIRPGTAELAVGTGPAFQRFSLTGAPLAEPVTARTGNGVLFSPDGRLLAATAGSAPVVQLYDAETGQPVGVPVQAPGARIGSIDFSPNGTAMAVGSDSGAVTVADTTEGFEGAVRAQISGLPGAAVAAFLDDDRLLASTDAGAAVYDLSRYTVLGNTLHLQGAVGEIVPLAGGDRALVMEAGDVRRLDADGGPEPTGLQLPVYADGPVAVSPDGRVLAALGPPLDDPSVTAAQLVLADLTTGSVTAVVTVPGAEESEQGRIAFSPDGALVAVGTRGGDLSVVDPSDGTVLRSAKLEQVALTSLLWSPDGTTLYEGGQDGVLRFVDPETLAVRDELPLTPTFDLSNTTAGPGGSPLVVASESGAVFLVDPQKRAVVGEPFTAAGTQLQSAVLSPDGTRVAAVSRDGTLRLWDRASGRAVGPPLGGNLGQAPAIAYLDGGRTLLTGGLAGDVIVWQTDPDRWVDSACRLAGRQLTRAEWDRYLPDQPYRRTCPA